MKGDLNRFFVSIVLPSILAIGLYVLSIFVVIVPSFERNIMEGKKEMISELTRTACSLIEEYHAEVLAGNMAEDSARLLAIERVKLMRYGDESKDYFWIIDWTPEMVMHPYRPELNGSLLTEYEDSEGKLLFVEATEIVALEGEGFIDYMWQWKDDSTKIVPKLSYVIGIEPWNWIVGTGIYLEDVRAEIRHLKSRLLKVGFLITVVISLILAFVIRSSLQIENRRKEAAEKLRLSREKYKLLVEASTEGTLMLVSDKIIFSNAKFSALSSYSEEEVRNLGIRDLFELDWEELYESILDPKVSVSRETNLLCKDGAKKEVVVSLSSVNIGGKSSYILIVKLVSGKQKYERASSQLEEELRFSILQMNQQVLAFSRKIRRCSIDSSIQDAVEVMRKKKEDVLFIHQNEQIVGVVTLRDLADRVFVEGVGMGMPVSKVMSSPVVSVDEGLTLPEAILEMKHKQVSSIAIRNKKGEIVSVAGYKDLVRIQQNSLAFFIEEISRAEEVFHLEVLYKRLVVLVGGLLDGGSKVQVVTRMISGVADAMMHRIIELAQEEVGEAPCRFTYMVMGSEGRREQTLATDQDNAIIIEDGGEKHQAYFLKLAEIVSKNLHAVGYAYCKGDVMAKNPCWCCELKTWKSYFSNWLQNSTPQDVLDAAIFFDFRKVYGDEGLTVSLREHISEVADHQSVFYYHMAQSLSKFKVASGLVSSLGKKEANPEELTFDIKRVLMPVSGYLRLRSIQEKLIVNNSHERASLLFEGEHIDRNTYELLRDAYEILSWVRLRSQLRQITENREVNNEVDASMFPGMDRVLLRKALKDVGDLLTKIGFEYGGEHGG